MVKTSQEIELLEERLTEEKNSEAKKIAEKLIADENHNGWVNRETWATVLHLQNDQLLYEASRDIARNSDKKRGVAADAFKQWIRTNSEGVLRDRDTNPSETWINLTAEIGSIWRVDWFAVADSFFEDIADDDE